MPFLTRRMFGVSAALAACALVTGAKATDIGPVVLTDAPVLKPVTWTPVSGGNSRRQLVLLGVRRSVTQPMLFDIQWLRDVSLADHQFVGTISVFGLPSPETLPPAQGQTLVFDITGIDPGPNPHLYFVPNGGSPNGRVIIDAWAVE